jgi:hypothetical protein
MIRFVWWNTLLYGANKVATDPLWRAMRVGLAPSCNPHKPHRALLLTLMYRPLKRQESFSAARLIKRSESLAATSASL